MMIWILVVIVVVVVGFLIDREIYFYEAAHLGPGIQAWLYDQWAKKYDEGKHASQMHDTELLARPLLDTLQTANISKPFVLDFATGTGRLSQALLNQADFTGSIVAVDLSKGMLEKAAAKLSQHSQRVEFLRHGVLPLPFPDAVFDAVCALEVLELFPDMNEPLAELIRVLRPGGVLLTSHGTVASGRRAVVKTEKEFASLLEKHNLTQIQTTKWWKLFDRVIAVKPGSTPAKGVQKLSEVLSCPMCNQAHWQREAEAWKCQRCGKELAITRDGIVLN